MKGRRSRRRRLFLPAPPARPRRLRPRHGRALRAGGLRRASRAPRQRRHAARRPRLGLRSPSPDRRLQPQLQREQPQPQGQVERGGLGVSLGQERPRMRRGLCRPSRGPGPGWGDLRGAIHRLQGSGWTTPGGWSGLGGGAHGAGFTPGAGRGG